MKITIDSETTLEIDDDIGRSILEQIKAAAAEVKEAEADPVTFTLPESLIYYDRDLLYDYIMDEFSDLKDNAYYPVSFIMDKLYGFIVNYEKENLYKAGTVIVDRNSEWATDDGRVFTYDGGPYFVKDGKAVILYETKT